MLLKIISILLTIVVINKVNAAEIIIQPDKIKLECQGSKLNAMIDVLATLTTSKTKLVSISTGGDGFCAAALEYLKIDQPTISIFESHITKVDYPINIFPCDLSMSVCSAIIAIQILKP